MTSPQLAVGKGGRPPPARRDRRRDLNNPVARRSHQRIPGNAWSRARAGKAAILRRAP